MNHIAGQPIPQAAGAQPALWYNYDVIMNHPLQVQVAVPSVQVISAAPQTPTPTTTPTPTPTPTPAPPPTPVPVAVSMISAKLKKVKKPPPEERERNYCCEVCGATFTNSSNLRIHTKIHLGVRPFVCTECGKSFIQSSNLKAHNRIHTGERPYKCSECGQTFSRSSHLVGHKRIHTGERPYICGICGEAFYTSSHMRNHVRRHTGEKPYVCQVCGEAFSQSVELRVHFRHHTGEKAFKCRECDSVFVSGPELRAHRKVSHSGSKPFRCEKCDRCFRTAKFYVKHELKCSGPHPKRPKGRPPKYPRDDGVEPSWNKSKKHRNKKPAAPTDRVSRSKTRALRIAQMKEEVKPEEQSNKNQKEVIPAYDQASDILEDSGSSDLPGGSPLKHEGLSESDEHISQLPMVHVMLDNFSSGADGIVLHSVPSGTLHGLHSLTDDSEQLGVMDLSGQQIHEAEHQNDSDPQTTLRLLPTQSMSVVEADHQLPLVADQEHEVSLDHHQITSAMVSQHSLNNHQKLPVVTTFQQSVTALPLSVTSSVTTGGSMTAIPQISAHHQHATNLVSHVSSHQPTHSQQQLSAVSAHQHTSVVSSHHQVPAVTSQQHLPSVTAIHNTSGSHIQLPTINAHQNQVGIGVHQQVTSLPTSLENTVTAHQNLTMASTHQQMSTASGHQMLPVVSAHQQQQVSAGSAQQLSTTANTLLLTGVSHHHAVNSHHQLPVVSAHQQTVANHLQLPTVSSRHTLPTILTAHQSSSGVQQQQHLVAVTAHQNVSSVPQQHLPAITAHQQMANTTDQQVSVAHLSNASAVASGVHQQGLVVSAHQQQVVPLVPVYKHSCNLGSIEDNSQVVYEGGQSFVVDLSSPALTPQVSLVDPPATSHSTRH